MENTEFVFVGYLVQEGYWTKWPMRSGYRVASIERAIHPDLDRIRWDMVGGKLNPTEFMTDFPSIPPSVASETKDGASHVFQFGDPSWTICGYALERRAIDLIYHSARTPRRFLFSRTKRVQTFEYALRLVRPVDDLVRLGYEVVDADFVFSSILNNATYSVDEIREAAGPLNKYSLFESAAHAREFCEVVRRPDDIGNIPAESRGFVVEVWGLP